MNQSELKIHRKNTEAFIDERPTVIALVPVNRTRTSSGGYTETVMPARASQTFRVIELSSPSAVTSVRLVDGTQREVQHQLLGKYNAVMAVNDRWTDPVSGRQWTIVDIAIDNGYEKRGMVIERGR